MDPIKHKEDTLPASAEVGDEGGSYAERMNQRATFSEAARPNIADERSIRGRAAARDLAARAPLEGDRDQEQPALRRHATEEPEQNDPREHLKARSWRRGLIGVAAGTAALLGVSRLRRRS